LSEWINVSAIKNNSSCVFFLLDRSASMSGNKLKELKEAANNFFKVHLKKIAKRNQIYVGVISFNSTSHLDFPLSDVSNSTTEDGFKNAVYALTANGETAVWDATGDAIDQFFNDSKINPNNQYIVFLVTDGEDNQSKRFPTGSAGLKPLIEYAKAKNIELIIYGVSIGTPNKDLEELASNFNGKIFTVKEIGEDFSKTMNTVGKIIQKTVDQSNPMRRNRDFYDEEDEEDEEDEDDVEDYKKEENANKEFYWRNYASVRNKRCHIDFFMKGKRCEDLNLTGESVLQYLGRKGFSLIAGTKDTEITFANDFERISWHRNSNDPEPCRTSSLISYLIERFDLFGLFHQLGYRSLEDMRYEFSCGSNPFSIFWNDVKYGGYNRYEYPGIFIKTYSPDMNRRVYEANVLFVKRIHAIEASLYYSLSSRLIAKYFNARPRTNPNEERVAISILAAMFTFLSFNEKEFNEVLTYSDIVGPSGFILNYIRALVRFRNKKFQDIQKWMTTIVQTIPWDIFMDPNESFAEVFQDRIMWNRF
jgi:uncharacterized protein YegL